MVPVFAPFPSNDFHLLRASLTTSVYNHLINVLSYNNITFSYVIITTVTRSLCCFMVRVVIQSGNVLVADSTGLGINNG